MVVGDVEKCAAPIPDFYPSIPDTTHPVAHKWTVPSSEFVGLGVDIGGGTNGGFSGTCWFYGMYVWCMCGACVMHAVVWNPLREKRWRAPL